MAGRLRIAICMEYPIEQMGGVETLVRELVRGLPQSFEIVLVSDDTPETLGSWKDLVSDHAFWSYESGTAGAAARLALELARLRVRGAHFHFGGTYAWLSKFPGQCPVLATRRLGIPCLLTNHLVTKLTEGFTNPARPLWFRMARLPIAWLSRLQVLRAVQREFTVSEADCHRERAIFFPFRSRIGRLYHSQLDENETAPATGREPEIVAVGSIGERKGQHMLVEAFSRIAARHPAWRVRIIGRGAQSDYLGRVEEAIARSGAADRIILAGRLSDEETVRAMYGAAIFAMPSFSEGLGLSLQEALFRGCACVASEVGGIPDMIQHEETGLLVPPGDAGALAGALERLIGDPGLRARLGVAGRAGVLAKGMTRQRMVERHAEVYTSLARGL